MCKKYKTTIGKSLGGITINAMAPEARDLLDKIMEDWQEWEKGLREMKRDYEPSIYAFAYWLVRWSGLIEPSHNK